MIPDAGEQRPSNAAMFRFMVPADVVKKTMPEQLIKDATKSTGLIIRIASDGSRRSVVSYPCRNHELLNVGCIAHDSIINLPTSDSSWSVPGSGEDLLRGFWGVFRATNP